MVSVWLYDVWCQCVDSASCTIYDVSVVGFNWLYDIWCQCGWIQLVLRYMMSVCVDSTGLRYMVSVCVDSTGCTIYGVSVGDSTGFTIYGVSVCGFNWL